MQGGLNLNLDPQGVVNGHPLKGAIHGHPESRGAGSGLHNSQIP